MRYAKERAWVERWLHMIDRSLTKQPAAALAIVRTATMIKGYGDAYRQGVADWHAIIDGLVKPTFDGVLDLPDLAGAVAEARAAGMPDPRQAALKRKIAEIRARAPAGSRSGRSDDRNARFGRVGPSREDSSNDVRGHDKTGSHVVGGPTRYARILTITTLSFVARRAVRDDRGACRSRRAPIRSRA